MSIENPDPTRKRRWRHIALWIGPWAFYLAMVVGTLIVEEVSRRGFGWLRVVVRNDVLQVLAVIVVAQWLAARVALGFLRKSALLAGAVTLLELPFAAVVYMFWAVGMIGGPINPG